MKEIFNSGFVLILTVLCIVACHPKKDTIVESSTIGSPETKVASSLQITQDTLLNISIVTGKFDPAHHPSFVKVDTQYANRAGLYLHTETYESFKKCLLLPNMITFT